jgi:hypothetical protein
VDRTQDATQNIRAILLVAGALLGAVGMSQQNSTLVYIAIGILAFGIVLAVARRVQIRRGRP